MNIVRFADEYELAAPLYDRSPEDLSARDRRQAQPVQRWLAIRNGAAVAAVSTWLRPDDRMFLHFVGHDGAFGPLGEMAGETLGRPVHAIVDTASREGVDSLQRAGFEPEVASEAFEIRFDAALAWLRRAWVPAGFRIVAADAVDEDRLFDLDNTLRRDTPGTDGWRGDREWFREEFTESPPFDPTAYLVAIHECDDYAGLVRIWRNPSGPRLGLIGVIPKYRNTTIAAALLAQALTAAATWGFDTFTTETSLSNRVIHPRMARLGAERTGAFIQVVRR